MCERFGFYGHQLTFLKKAAVQTPTEDALWLSACVPKGVYGRVIDIGAGSGAVGLSLAIRLPGRVNVLCLEKDAQAFSLLEEHIQLNQQTAFVSPWRADLFAEEGFIEAFDVALTNPPFYLAEKGHLSVQPYKKEAHYLTEDALEKWLMKTASFVKDKGFLGTILHVEALPIFLRTLGEYTVDIIFLKRAEAAPKRFLAWVKKEKSVKPFQVHHLCTQHENVRQKILHGSASVWDCLEEQVG